MILQLKIILVVALLIANIGSALHAAWCRENHIALFNGTAALILALLLLYLVY